MQVFVNRARLHWLDDHMKTCIYWSEDNDNNITSLHYSYQLLELNQKKDFKSLTSQEKQQKTKWGFFIPEEESELVKLAGIGIKTAKVVEAVIFEKATVAVDTHVHRVLNRLNIVQTKTCVV